MAFRSTHNSFSLGELDPALLARFDVDLYTKGARKIRNMVSIWTGGAAIRAGSLLANAAGVPFVFIDRTNANAPITDADNVNGVMFDYDTDEEFVYTIMAVEDTTNGVAFEIFYNNTFQVTVVGDIGGAKPWTTANIKDLHFVVGQDRVIIMYESKQLTQLIRTPGAAHNVWTLKWLQPTTYPGFDFTTVNTGETQYRLSTVTFTPSATTGIGITITCTIAIFNDNHVSGLFAGDGGVLRITAVNAAGTVATGDVLVDFPAAAAIKGTLCSVEEVMWSPSVSNPPAVVRAGTDRGWPARGTFFINRLALGRSATLKNIGALSNSGVFERFDDSEELADNAFSFTLNSRGNQVLQDIVGDDSLLFLGSTKTYATNPLTETPLSAANFYAPPQAPDTAADIPAVTIDNQILHVTREKTQVNRVMYSTADAKYIATPSTLLSSHLVTGINSNAGWQPANKTVKLYQATQTDGSMLSYNTLIQEGISAWSMSTTRGKYKRVLGDGVLCDTVVERQISLGAASYSSGIDYGFLASANFSDPGAAHAFDDITTQLADAAVDVEMFTNVNEYLVLGNDVPWTDMIFTLNTVASATIIPTFEYLDGNGSWNVFTPTADNTTGFTVANDINWTTALVSGWAPATVNGVEDKYWIRIRRTEATLGTPPIEDTLLINTGARLMLERLSFDDYMDSSWATTSDATGAVTGLTHLAGQQVYAIANGATQGPYFVSSTGTTNITNEYAAVKIGVQYKPLLVPMPVFTPSGDGDNIYKEKMIQQLFVDYVDSLYIEVDGKQVPSIKLGAFVLGTPVTPLSDFYPVTPRYGWKPRQEVKITQTIPGPMTIIGVGYHTEIT